MQPPAFQTGPFVADVRCLRAGPPLPLPLAAWRVCAGFPSPAEPYLEGVLDLNELLVRHPAATFMMRVQGRSMEEAGIHDGDLVVVDRALEPRHGDIVIAALDGSLTVKRLHCRGGTLALIPASGTFTPIPITGEMEMVVWGVVTHAIHEVR